MPRVKRGKIAHKKRERLLKYTKGFRWGRKSKERAAKEALLHAWTHAFRGRKQKKGVRRRLWNVRVNAGARAVGTKYSALVSGLKRKSVKLNRKMLAELAEKHPAIFERIASAAKE